MPARARASVPDAATARSQQGSLRVGIRLGRVMLSVGLLKIRLIKPPVVRLLLQRAVDPYRLGAGGRRPPEFRPG